MASQKYKPEQIVTLLREKRESTEETCSRFDSPHEGNAFSA
jgi:hypothetical protein